MKERKIQVTPAQLDKLMAEDRALPSTPVGDHLSDDEFISYTMETLEPQQFERIDGHLASCPECTIEMKRLVEASEIWRGEDGEQRLAELEARTCAAMKQPSLRSAVISDITRALLAKLAPDELPLFPPRKLILTRQVGESLIFGDDVNITVLGIKGNQVRLGVNAPKEIAVHRVVLLTPVALAVVIDSVQFVWERATDTIKEEETTSTRERFAHLHKRAFETSCQLKLPESQARALANALVEVFTENLESQSFQGPDQSALG